MGKKINKLILALLIATVLVFTNKTNLSAATANVSISINGTYEVGSTVSITVNYSHVNDTNFDFRITSSDNSILSINESVKDFGTGFGTKSGSKTYYNLILLSKGEVTINVRNVDSVSIDPAEEVGFSASRTIKVVEKTPTTPNPPTKPTDPPIIKDPEPEVVVKKDLIKSIDIISNSEKMKGETLKTIVTESGVREYEFLLPKGIDSFYLNVIGSYNDVEINHNESYTFKEDENEMNVSIKSNAGDVSEEYIIKVKRTVKTEYDVELGGNNYSIYDDESVALFLSGYGFAQEIISVEGKDIPVFKLNETRMQLFTDESNNAYWLIYNINSFDQKAIMLIDKNNKPFFIVDAPDELSKQLIKEKSYIERDYVAGEIFTTINKELNFNGKYKAWDYESNELVYGFTSDNTTPTTYLYDKTTNEFTRVILEVVNTENDNTNEIIYITIIGILSAVILGTYITLFVKSKQKKKKDLIKKKEAIIDSKNVNSI